MAKKMTAGQFVVSSIRKELGYGRTLASMKVIDMAMAEVINRTIQQAVRAEYTRMLSLASNLAASGSGLTSNRPRVKIEDLKLPKTWGTIRPPAKVKVRKARKSRA